MSVSQLNFDHLSVQQLAHSLTQRDASGLSTADEWFFGELEPANSLQGL
jgi:hypothetical protein